MAASYFGQVLWIVTLNSAKSKQEKALAGDYGSTPKAEIGTSGHRVIGASGQRKAKATAVLAANFREGRESEKISRLVLQEPAFNSRCSR